MQGGDGQTPRSVPIEASDGNLYGTTEGGGVANVGSTIYRYTRSGVFSTLYQFDGTNGQYVLGPLVQASDGKLYGIAYAGGANGCGTVFSMRTSAAAVRSYSFHCRSGGSGPLALIQASDGNLYGTTDLGGTGNFGNGFGTVFKFVPKSALSILYRFQGSTDGSRPAGGLVQARDGNLYGAATKGGSSDIGTIFQITTTGAYKQLYSFVQTTGQFPESSLLQHTNGLLYGTANQGAANGFGAVYSLDLGLGPFITFHARPVPWATSSKYSGKV